MRYHLLTVALALLAFTQDAAIDQMGDSRAWKEVRRLEIPSNLTFSGTSFSLGGIVICPLEQDKLGVFLAYAVETLPEPEDLRVAFIDKDGKRHAAFSNGYGSSGSDVKGIRAHLFVTPKSCPRAHVRKIILDQFKIVSAEELPVLQEREQDLQKWEDYLQEREEQRLAEYLKDSPLGIPIVGKPYPFKLTELNGNEVSTDKWKGKVILMDFWATWCGPCVAEMPKLKKLYEKYHDRGLEVVGISSDFKRAPLTEYVKVNDIRWPQVYLKDLGENRQTAVLKTTGVTAIPRYFVIDRDGKLHTDRGRDRLEEIIPKLLAK
ncbi:MAG: TlpA family protein disulfide reductase [Planctomycetes bacterium]|nr:TlpA family protein disulfide reductase [Planctomycetota bacterium]